MISHDINREILQFTKRVLAFYNGKTNYKVVFAHRSNNIQNPATPYEIFLMISRTQQNRLLQDCYYKTPKDCNPQKTAGCTYLKSLTSMPKII